ncbi:amidohydrolase family protein [Terriglobus sp. 2YAB30_2]|uniref:metal-dependent hydrolase family protein n=1 Tax=unclassified Terriglobus TaxID=2628988 RepID=UPI003F953F9D
MKTILATLLLSSSLLLAQQKQTVLHAARLYEAETGRILTPGEILVEGDHIAASGTRVERPAGAEVIDLGDRTLMPGLIDAHTHLFLHPGAEDAQTFEESVPRRTLLAAEAAKQDLLAGFTAERDMGTEGAGSADSAVRNAINSGLIPGPRMRVSGNAISITGGHEDAVHYNPELHVPSNATYADTADDLVRVIRQQLKEGADFIKIYATGSDRLRDGVFSSPYQYTEDQLKTAVDEARRQGATIGVHCSTDPAALFAVRAGVVSIDHADQLAPETMRLMREKQIYAVPTFAISEYFEQHASTPAAAASRHAGNQFHIAEFKKQMAAGVPFAVGSDVGPFPHGTQAREMVLMAEYGMKPAEVLQADYVHGARLLGWEGRIGTLRPGAWADVIAVPGNPLDDISALTRVAFVMKNGQVYKR